MKLERLFRDADWTDPSLWGVVAGNVVSIVMALVQGWNLGEVLWIYWIQSVLIGLINFFRILTLRDFSTAGLKSNGKPVPETPAARRGVAFFFLFHYGFFHFVYAMFLSQQMALGDLDRDTIFFLLICAMGFAGAHGFSFAHNRSRDFRDKRPNLGAVMFYPYIRILPMHFTIILGGAFSVLSQGWGTALVLLFFMILKTVADAAMHLAEHRLFQDKDPSRTL